MGRGISKASRELQGRIYEVFVREQPMGPRRVAYALFGNQAGAMAGKVSSLCKRMLERGALPLAWYDDASRVKVEPHTAESLDGVVEAGRRVPQFDPWVSQPRRVEVWSEKSVGDTLEPVLNRYAVTFINLRGNASTKILMSEAEKSWDDPRPLDILYAGDHDAPGLYMSECDLPGRLKRYGARNVTVSRVAITGEDFHTLKAEGLADPIKPLDKNKGWYVRHTGESVGVELEAMPAPELRDRVEEAIRERISDPEAWNRIIDASAAVQASWEAYVDLWPRPDISIPALGVEYEVSS